MKNRKYIACLLAGGLFCIPMPAGAAESYTYTILEDGTAEIQWTDTAVVHAQIPEKVEGVTVSALAEDCFKGCTALTDVDIPDTVTSIGENAFNGCTSLQTFAVPENISEIGDFAFEGCTSLIAIEVAEDSEYFSDDNGVLYNKAKQELIRYPAAREDVTYTTPDSCTALAPWSFTECSNLQLIELPKVTAIGSDAFFCASSIQTVKLSEGLTELIGASFAYCTNLRKISLPSTLKTIGDKCFYGCVSLPSVTLPDKLSSIGEQAFYGCVQMKEMEIPSSVKSIGNMGVGYSVDPDTNENTVITGFKVKTVANSQAQKYAKKNNISYDAPMQKSFTILILVVIAAAAAAALAIVLTALKKADAAKKAEAQKREEKRRKRRERRNKQGESK